MWRIYELTPSELFIWFCMIAADIIVGILTIAFVIHVVKSLIRDLKENKRDRKK